MVKLFEKMKGFNLEREALIASGLSNENQITSYLFRLNALLQLNITRDFTSLSNIEKAKILFESLWKHRPDRYRRHGDFRLDRVIDAHLNKGSQVVCNCLGLTLLYNCLLKKIEIQPKVLYLENAFNIGPHVLTVFQSDNDTIDVENILPYGFDYNGHKQNPLRLEWGDRELVADIYQSLGTEFFKKEKLEKALENYEMALNFNPKYEKAKLNKFILLNCLK